MSKFKFTLTIDLTLDNTLRVIWGELQTQMTNMYERIEPQESSWIRHLKTNKYHKNNHCRQVHPKHH